MSVTNNEDYQIVAARHGVELAEVKPLEKAERYQRLKQICYFFPSVVQRYRDYVTGRELGPYSKARLP